jgi:acetoin utilization protein AcuB
MPGARPIKDFMTTAVHSVHLETSLEDAHRAMRDRGVRHLPVLDGDKLVGIVSERELELLRSFPMIDMSVASVSDAMPDQTYVVGPDTPLREVVRTMAEKKYGSALVVEDQRVRGIFTTVDALAVVDLLLSSE